MTHDPAMSVDEIIQTARECQRLAMILRESCTSRVDVSEDARVALSDITTATVVELRWILGRNFGSDTIDIEVRTAARMVPQASVIVDVGANAGHWSQLALKAFPHAEVIGFEPQDAHRTNLSQLRDISQSRFRFYPIALSNFKGKAQLYSNEAGSGLASLYQRDLRRFYGVDMKPAGNVETSTLAEQIRTLSLKGIDILKVDVEGHELSVLEGAGVHINNIKYIQFEFGGAMMDSKVPFRDFMTFFADLPFRIYRLSPIGLIAIPPYNEGLEGYEMSNYVAIHKDFAHAN